MKKNMLKIETYTNKVKKNIEIIIAAIEKQIFHQDEKFVLNSRMLLEIFYYYIINFENSFSFEINDERIKFKESQKNENNIKNLKSIIIIEKIKTTRDEISEYLHWFDLQEEMLILTADKIEKIIKKINKIIFLINETKCFEIDIRNIKVQKYKKIKFNTSSISLNEVLFIDILEESYNLPMFQRKFTWTCDKINDLFKEIIKGEHDLGIIYITNENEIIDGQQRLHSIYIINKILYLFFNEKIKNKSNGKEEFKDFKTIFNRKRESEKDWRSNQSLLEKEINISDKEESKLNCIYLEIEKNENNLQNIYENINKVFVNFKKIEDIDGIKYFNKINNQGVPLKRYENLLSFFIYKYKLNENEKKEIYYKWSILDDLCLGEIKNNFIEGILEFVENDKYSFTKNFIFIFFENLIKILKNEEKEKKYFILQNNIFLTNLFILKREYLQLLFFEMKNRIEFSFQNKKDGEDLFIIKKMKDDFYNSDFYFIFIKSFLEKVSNKYLITYFNNKDLINLNNSLNFNNNIFSKINKKDIELLKILTNKVEKPKFLNLIENEYILKINNSFNQNNFIDISIINTYRIIEEIIGKFIKNELILFENINDFIINKLKETPNLKKNLELILNNNLNNILNNNFRILKFNGFNFIFDNLEKVNLKNLLESLNE